MPTKYRTAAHEAIATAYFPRRFNGYIPDADHKRRQKDASIKFGGGTSSLQGSLAAFRAPFMDQGTCGSCTGHGTPQAIYTSAGASGNKLPFVPSPRVTYALARTLERPDASQALSDSGAMPSDILTVLRQYGIAPIASPTPDGRYSDVWSLDDTAGLLNPPPPNVNAEVDLLDLETAGLKLLTGEYRIDEASNNFASLIKASIRLYAAAGIGIFVDTGFMRWDPATGPIWSINLKDQGGGGHWLSLDYFYTTSKGVIVFGGPNSWGESWPQATGKPPESPYWVPGCYEITAPCLQSVCSDCLLFPVTIIPVGS